MIKQNLSGKRIAITGATGFLGTALVERLLSSIPDCELLLLVRPGRRGAEKRAEREILRNDAFDNLREKLGNDGFEELCKKRIKFTSFSVKLIAFVFIINFLEFIFKTYFPILTFEFSLLLNLIN